MLNKQNHNMKFSQPHGVVKYMQAKGRTEPAPSRSNRRATATAPPAYMSKAEQIKKANEFLKILFSA